MRKPTRPPPWRLVLPPPGPWVREAACAGMVPAHDARLPSEESDGPAFTARVTAAKRRCARCPVLDSCEEWAASLPRGHLSGVIAGEYYRDNG